MSVATMPAQPAMAHWHTEQALFSLPPLEEMFAHWDASGVSSTMIALQQREQVLGVASLSSASLQLLYEIATQHIQALPSRSSQATRPLHKRLVRHAASQTAAETQALLPAHVVVQKTVSLEIAGKLMVCSSVGDQLLARQHLRAIAAMYGLPRRSLKHATLNPATCDPVEVFEMAPGMVSPFFRPHRATRLDALILLPWPESWEEQEQEVAVSLSLWESLLLPLRCLKGIVSGYARQAYPSVRLIEVPSPEKEKTHVA